MKAGSPYSSNLLIPSRLSLVDFDPDGELSKKDWREADWATFDHDWSGEKRFPEAETRVASLCTSSHVYFAFRCKYSTLNVFEGEDPSSERWGLWERDVVEVFVNPQPERMNHYYEFEVAPNNQWIDLEIDLEKEPFNDAAWDSHFAHATRLDPTNHFWSCELRIPVASMGVKAIRTDTEWRINFYRADGLGSDTERRLVCWSPVQGETPNFHVPSRFGIIRFIRG